MRETPDIAAARIEAERARARLMGSAHELQERLSPRTLARDAWQGAKAKSGKRKPRKRKQDNTEAVQ